MYHMHKSAVSIINFLHRGCTAVRYCSTAAIPKESKWDLMGAIVVERKPVVTKELKGIEKRFSSILQQVEYEKSLKSDNEVTDELEKKEAELIKMGKIKDLDLDAVVKQTAQDFRDMCSEELAKFKFAPRVTGFTDWNFHIWKERIKLGEVQLNPFRINRASIPDANMTAMKTWVV